MAVPVEELRLYCRADDDEATTQLLTTLGETAEAYLSSACGVVYAALTGEQLPLYTMAVKLLVLHYYDNPGGGDPPPGLRNIINSIKEFRV